MLPDCMRRSTLPTPCDAGADAVHHAVDHALIDAAPQHDVRERHQRLDDDRVVDFVDEVFVVDQSCKCRASLRRFIGQLGRL